jgi:hypothetical protein
VRIEDFAWAPEQLELVCPHCGVGLPVGELGAYDAACGIDRGALVERWLNGAAAYRLGTPPEARCTVVHPMAAQTSSPQIPTVALLALLVLLVLAGILLGLGGILAMVGFVGGVIALIVRLVFHRGPSAWMILAIIAASLVLAVIGLGS